MKVQCTKITDASGQHKLTRSHRLAVGCEYVVLSIEASPGRQVSLRLVGDDKRLPALHSSDQFIIVTSDMPSNWEVQIGKNGFLELAPHSWLRAGFWEDYFDGEQTAIAAYEEARQSILAETG